jgi:uncharacterized membrane protein YbaN (DUF454 family)
VSEGGKPDSDFSHEVTLAPSRGSRAALLLLGHFCVVLGVIGIFLPVMPTTVFLLGAAACYSRASGRFYNRLLNNRVFGPVIADWRHHRAMTLRAKTMAIGFVVLGIGATVIFGVERLWLRLVLIGIAVAVAAFLLSIRTRRDRPSAISQ